MLPALRIHETAALHFLDAYMRLCVLPAQLPDAWQFLYQLHSVAEKVCSVRLNVRRLPDVANLTNGDALYAVIRPPLHVPMAAGPHSAVCASLPAAQAG